MTIKRFLTGLVIFFIVTQLTQCQKEYSTTNTKPADSTVVTKNDSTLLKLYVVLDTLHPASQDTLYKMEFAYDNLKRLSSYDFSDYDSATGAYDLTIHFKVFYNGIDTLPFKVTLDEPILYNSGTNLVTVYQNGKLYSLTDSDNKDTVVTYSKKVYQYSGDNDVAIVYGYPSGVCGNDTIYHTALLSNGNVVKDQNTYPVSPFNLCFYTPHIEGMYIYENSFDTHPNPFKKINFIFQLWTASPFVPGEDGTFLYTMARCNNNIIESKCNVSLPPFYSQNNLYSKKYIYNSNGFPSSASFTKNLDLQNQLKAGRELYFYTK